MPVAPPAPIPIGAREIVLENFRGIASLELKFLDATQKASDIVILAGPNGSGKTSVLEACLLALGHPELIRSANARRPVRAGAGAARVVVQVQTPTGVQERVWSAESKPARRRQLSGPRKASTSSSRSREDQEPIPCLYFSSWRSPQLIGAVPVTTGHGAARLPEREWNRVGLFKQFLVNAKAHAFMRQQPPPEGASTFRAALNGLNEVWRMFHPGTDRAFTVDPVGDDPSLGFDVFLSGPGQPQVPLDALGAGGLELVALFGDFLRLQFGSGVVLIDEPELHLDAQWHALMVRALRRFLPQAQLVLATHSPEVYDSVYSFQRHLLLPVEGPRNVAWKARLDGVAG
jgi:energy-coupling factor transporter ATP-binding protein EcfA2